MGRKRCVFLTNLWRWYNNIRQKCLTLTVEIICHWQRSFYSYQSFTVVEHFRVWAQRTNGERGRRIERPLEWLIDPKLLFIWMVFNRGWFVFFLLPLCRLSLPSVSASALWHTLTPCDTSSANGNLSLRSHRLRRTFKAGRREGLGWVATPPPPFHCQGWQCQPQAFKERSVYVCVRVGVWHYTMGLCGPFV